MSGLGYIAYNLIAAKILEARVAAAIPKVCAEIRDQRGKLVTGIEAYRAHFRVYLPDHVLSRQPLARQASILLGCDEQITPAGTERNLQPAGVSRCCHITFQSNRYSVPYLYASQP